MTLRSLFYALPPNLRFVARRLYYLPSDTVRGLRGLRHPYEPPRGAIYTGAGDIIEQGRQQFGLLRTHIDVQPGDSVLDIGSGIGRTAIPLTEYLSAKGQYEGFDVVEKGVIWCRTKITPAHPNFTFTYVPLNNDLYNNSELRATEFTFPYADQSFDKTFLFSVFTHMGIEEIAHYLTEINRVLVPGGRCLATFFTYDDDSEAQVARKPKFSFPVRGEGYRLMDANVTAANIAVHRNKLRGMIADAGLRLDAIVDGTWNGAPKRPGTNEFQDVVVISKPT